jgi:DNA-binding PadR family transcriptional regulator
VALSTTAYCVLGLLSFDRELSGYDLKKWADHSLSLFYWSPATSQIYGELRRLETHGYVSSREVPQDELRNKRVYVMTESGKDILTRWLVEEPVGVPVLKHPVLLRVWLGHLVEPERLRAVIQEHLDQTTRQLEVLGRDLQITSADADMRYPELILRWAERHHRAEQANAEQLLREIDEARTAAGTTPPGATTA